MKNIDIISLYQAIQNCGSLVGAKFAYALSKNADKLKVEIKALEEAIKFSKEYVVYDAERVELAKKFSKKDSKGEPVTIPTGSTTFDYDIEDQAGFDAEFKVLKGKNKELITKREKQVEEYLALLKEGAEKIKFHMVNIKDVPENITAAQLGGISIFITE